MANDIFSEDLLKFLQVAKAASEGREVADDSGGVTVERGPIQPGEIEQSFFVGNTRGGGPSGSTVRELTSKPGTEAPNFDPEKVSLEELAKSVQTGLSPGRSNVPAQVPLSPAQAVLNAEPRFTTEPVVTPLQEGPIVTHDPGLYHPPADPKELERIRQLNAINPQDLNQGFTGAAMEGVAEGMLPSTEALARESSLEFLRKKFGL